VDLVTQRLRNSRLHGSSLSRAAEVVRWLGAVQAQEPLGAWWSVGQRAPGLSERDVVAAFDAGEVIRTHVLRPTWHLVAAEDVRWLQRVTAPRVHAVNRSRYAQLDLDAVTRDRAAEVLAEAVRGERHPTRPELGEALEAAGIELAGHPEPGQRLAYLVMHAELEAVLCSGPMRGAQHTYASVDERVPVDGQLAVAAPRPHDDDLAELATRYLRGRGPATAADLAWWASLTITEAARAIGLAGVPEVGDLDGRPAFAFAPLEVVTVATGPLAHLLPTYDELFIGLRDRSATFDPTLLPDDLPTDAFERGVVTVDGRAAGGWRRTLRGVRGVDVEVTLRRPLDVLEKAAVRVAAERYATHLDRDLHLEVAAA
jgi:hypothetical protein